MRLPELTITSKGDHVLVSIEPIEGTRRAPVDVCCVVDISASMESDATVKGAGGDVESFGLTLLDVVKHAVKTIIHTLGDGDRLSIVSFSTQAKMVFELTEMNLRGRQRALAALNQLRPEGQTNLWDGLFTGLEMMRKSAGDESNAIRQCMVFTDGMPNIVPPRGHQQMLKRYRAQHGGRLPCSIQTFGFGYSLDSKLLEEISVAGSGMYAFIPDSSFVGTVFVNALSNLQTTIASDVVVNLEPLNGAKILGCLGGHTVKKEAWGIAVRPGSIRYGQPKNLVLRMDLPPDGALPYLKATLEMKIGTGQPAKKTVTSPSREQESDEVEVHRLRLRVVDTLKNLRRVPLAQAQGTVRDLSRELVASCVAGDPLIGEIGKDLTGQITEAVSRQDWFDKWGTHYVPSLLRAHLLQVCSNFKDPGLQGYGGKLFNDLRELAEKTFADLPPPKPTGRPAPAASSGGGGSRGGGRGRAAVRRPIVSMSSYCSRGNPCFAGECMARMADGSCKRVDQLKRGDLVRTAAQKSAKVVCVLKTVCAGGQADLVRLGSLFVTPWHPVRVEGVWRFPSDLGRVLRDVPCDAVYSFFLDSGHTMFINGVEAVSLGHAFQDAVVAHPYFGSERIVEDVRRMKGWEKGVVELRSGCLLREHASGLVTGLHQ